jgi:NAD(P)-dependent dehydrogenase (short-subunit alcohol dehydrogenase family)
MPVVFITGGARRIGKGLATEFARRGWDVGFTYHTSEQQAQVTTKELMDLGVRSVAVQANVADEDQLASSFNTLMDKLGSPEVIVSNAGIFPPQRDVLELSLQHVRETIDVNTLPLLTIGRWYSALPQGRLISLSSLGAFEIWKRRLDYNMSKVALVNLTQTLARAMAPSHTVNSVAPGAIEVPGEVSDADAELATIKRIPMERYGTPSDVFDAVWFFATASAYITGQVIIVDGGYHLVR